MTTEHTVLSEKEIDDIFGAKVVWPRSDYYRGLARAVERAVLAKVCGHPRHNHRHVEGLRALFENVTEAEARERERVAYRLGLGHGRISPITNGLDSYYPAIPPVPKEVRGPSGRRYHLEDGLVREWCGDGRWHAPQSVVYSDVPAVANLMQESK